MDSGYMEPAWAPRSRSLPHPCHRGREKEEETGFFWGTRMTVLPVAGAREPDGRAAWAAAQAAAGRARPPCQPPDPPDPMAPTLTHRRSHPCPVPTTLSSVALPKTSGAPGNGRAGLLAAHLAGHLTGDLTGHGRRAGHAAGQPSCGSEALTRAVEGLRHIRKR